MRELYYIFGPRMDVAAVMSQTIIRLGLAAVLGGACMEPEMKHKPAGLLAETEPE
jgi:uncharacterized membrane protein YhiD involved in acid resistance